MIRNIISQVFDGKYLERDIATIKGIMVHRVGVDLGTPSNTIGDDAITICRAFQGLDPRFPGLEKYTGGQNPYTIMIGGNCGPGEEDGVIWQTMPLDEVGWHARRFSKGHVGVACIGDFRHEPMSERQKNSLLYVLAVLCLGLKLDPYKSIKGHGEVPGAHGGKKAPGQPYACPGDCVQMNLVRDDVAQVIASRSRSFLADHGLAVSLSST